MSKEQPNTIPSSESPQSTEQPSNIITCDAVYCNGEYLPDAFFIEIDQIRQSGYQVFVEDTGEAYVARIY